VIDTLQHFAKMQEALRKDVQQAFGVLQARFAIVAQPAQGWSKLNLHKIMTACIILHNMIVEDERGSPKEFVYDTSTAIVEPGQSTLANFSQFVINNHLLHDATAHHQLRNDLIKHLWALKGQSHME
jgi:hypothetical protein